MSIFEDGYLEHVEKMPLATAGELKMWNLSLSGFDLGPLAEQQWVFIGWEPAYQLAVSFLEKMALTRSEIRNILALPEGNLSEAPDTLSLETRHRLYDVHRIHIALVLLYPDQPDHQRYWFTAKDRILAGKTAIEVMTSEGTERVRKLLEGRLNE